MSNFPNCVKVCQNRSCKKQGADQVLAALKATPLDHITIEPSGCLGQCGSGPMILVLPGMFWYSHVQSHEVTRLIEQHLIGGEPVKKMLYLRFHSQANSN
jgi:(2Fe-2S) ferredoxin